MLRPTSMQKSPRTVPLADSDGLRRRRAARMSFRRPRGSQAQGLLNQAHLVAPRITRPALTTPSPSQTCDNRKVIRNTIFKAGGRNYSV